MNSNDINPNLLRDTLARRSRRMTAPALTPAERADIIAARVAAPVMTATPRRSVWSRIAATAAVVALIAVPAAIWISDRAATRAPGSMVMEQASLLQLPEPVDEAVATVIARPAEPVSPKPLSRPRTARRKPEEPPLSRHDRILAEIIAAETEIDLRSLDTNPDPRRETAAVFEASRDIMKYSSRYPSSPSDNPHHE